MAAQAGSTGMELMPPPRPRGPQKLPPKPQQLVLEEDEWAEQLESIIERDFFPDVPKLQSKLEWLQALRTRDPAALRQAQVNIAARRAGIRTPIGATPGSFETPGASLLRAPHGINATPATPAMTPLMGRYGGAVPGRGDGQDSHVAEPDPAQRPAQAPLLTLDRFLAKHTSEDNASFAELLQDMNERRKQAAPWLHRAHVQAPLTIEGQQAAGEERTADGYGTGGQEPLRMLLPAHEHKNRLYYDGSQHDAYALSAAEQAQLTAGPPKAIAHRNTRFVAPSAQSGASTPGSSTPSGAGTDGTPADAGSSEGVPSQYGGFDPSNYAMLATPTMTPGAGGESPFMTWGDIAGTPLRLDAENTLADIGGGPGPRFSMAAFPRKDAITRHMAAKASSSLKRKAAAYAGTPLARQAAAAAAAAAGTRTPGDAGPKAGAQTPGRHSAATPLSAAGRKLASSLRAAGRTPGGAATPDAADKQLRASYRTQTLGATPRAGSTLRRDVGGGGGGGSGRGDNTPAIGSDEAARLAKLRAAALRNKRRLAEGMPPATGKLTDDLLNI